MDFMLAFWCSLAIWRPFIIRFLKIIIHIAITSRIIDNKLDNWGSGSSFSDSSNICSITFLENAPAPQQTACFAQFWLNLLPRTALFLPGWRLSIHFVIRSQHPGAPQLNGKTSFISETAKTNLGRAERPRTWWALCCEWEERERQMILVL